MASCCAWYELCSRVLARILGPKGTIINLINNPIISSSKCIVLSLAVHCLLVLFYNVNCYQPPTYSDLQAVEVVEVVTKNQRAH